jgi:hypothetical protein
MGNKSRFLGAAGLVAAVACIRCGGGDDGGASGTTADEGGSIDGGSSNGPGGSGSGSSVDDNGSDTADGGELCGNGVTDPGEECDDADANSDTTPDACRADCREARCFDGVVDPLHGEECDDGSENSSDPNACRATCVLPHCGDGTQDMGEACDDGNEAWGDTCYECTHLWYFILNSPDSIGAGDASILRTTRDGPPVQIVGDDPSYDGIRQLGLAELGVTLFALQSNGAVDRVLLFDPVTGTLDDEVDIGTAALGYDPDARAMVRASDNLLWIAVAGRGSARMVTVDPRTHAVTEVLDLGGITVEDMAADTAGGLYLTTGTGNGIVRVDVTGPTSAAFAGSLSNPIGITYDRDNELVWVANNPNGAPVDIVRFDLGGTPNPYSVAGTDVAPYVHGLAIDVGGVVLATERSLDRVVAVQNFDAVQDFFTAMVVAPTDIEILDMAR